MDDFHSINEAINAKAGRKLGPSILVSLAILAVVFLTISFVQILFALFAWIAIKLGATTNLRLKVIAGIGALAGMGMTVSLVIAEIAAKNDAELNEVRLGLFISAILSGLVGYIWLRRTPASQ